MQILVSKLLANNRPDNKPLKNILHSLIDWNTLQTNCKTQTTMMHAQSLARIQ